VRDTPALLDLPHFTTHDGRRAFSTWAHENLEHPDVVEACLGHIIKGVRGIYARPQFEAARRRLMQAWSDHLHAMTQDKVIPLRSSNAA
jgi:integrase